MKKKTGLTDEERDLWQQATKDVTPLPKKRLAKPAASQAVLPAPRKKIKPSPVLPAPNPAPTLSKGGIDTSTAAKVKRGEFAIDGRIDLHGMTLAEAHVRLTAFIESSCRQGLRCLLVITGKGRREAGQPTIQKEAPRWLAHSQLAGRILMISSAQPRHGGKGALYVLLRRQK